VGSWCQIGESSALCGDTMSSIDPHTLVFGSKPQPRASDCHRSVQKVYDRYDLLEVYPDARMFQVKIGTRDALIDIAEALK
jgi:hypothetical protein